MKFTKTIIIAVTAVFTFNVAQAQDKYFTKTGTVNFYSNASLENIEAKNKTATAVLDTKTGGLQFSVQMKGFEFEKALMQQHFNETYVESDKYPKADFVGVIANNKSITYKKDGTYKVMVVGKLTLHGQTKTVKAPGTIKVEAGKLAATSSFIINLSEYKISIPSKAKDKISNTIQVTVDASLDPYNA